MRRVLFERVEEVVGSVGAVLVPGDEDVESLGRVGGETCADHLPGRSRRRGDVGLHNVRHSRQLGDDGLNVGLSGGGVNEALLERNAGRFEVLLDAGPPCVGVRLPGGAPELGRRALVQAGAGGEHVPARLDRKPLLDALPDTPRDGGTEADDGARDGDRHQGLDKVIAEGAAPVVTRRRGGPNHAV